MKKRATHMPLKMASRLPQMPVDMVIRGTTAFVACASGGGCLALVDIADPADPRVVSTLSPYGTHSVELYGDYALFTTAAPTFIADVSDPAAPELVSWVATGGAVLAVADAMFVGDGDHNLRYYDIVDPADRNSPAGVAPRGTQHRQRRWRGGGRRRR